MWLCKNDLLRTLKSPAAQHQSNDLQGVCYATGVSAELIGILSVGAALAGLILAGKRDMERRLSEMDRRLARVERLLEGLGLAGRVSSPAAGA